MYQYHYQDVGDVFATMAQLQVERHRIGRPTMAQLQTERHEEGMYAYDDTGIPVRIPVPTMAQLQIERHQEEHLGGPDGAPDGQPGGSDQGSLLDPAAPPPLSVLYRRGEGIAMHRLSGAVVGCFALGKVQTLEELQARLAKKVEADLSSILVGGKLAAALASLEEFFTELPSEPADEDDMVARASSTLTRTQTEHLHPDDQALLGEHIAAKESCEIHSVGSESTRSGSAAPEVHSIEA